MPMPYTQGKRTLTIFFEDFNGYTGRHELNFLVSETNAGIRSFAETYCQRVKVCIDAGVMGYNITDRFWYTDPDAPDVASDITDTCTLWLSDATSERGQVTLPAINPVLLVATGPYSGLQLDPTNATVQAYIAELQNFCNENGLTHQSLLMTARERGRLVR